MSPVPTRILSLEIVALEEGGWEHRASLLGLGQGGALVVTVLDLRVSSPCHLMQRSWEEEVRAVCRVPAASEQQNLHKLGEPSGMHTDWSLLPVLWVWEQKETGAQVGIQAAEDGVSEGPQAGPRPHA